MAINRRTFLGQTLAGSIISATTGFPLLASEHDPEITKITILHTNDVHSRIDPFPMDGSRNEGMGGAAKRAKLIAAIREKEQHVLLLDSGDMFQGTPYFNFFGGELEIKLMSEMGYDAGTLGNHDFDGGIDGFDQQLPHASFPFIVSNYDFDDTVLNGKINRHKIIEKGGIKFGLVGAGIELEGLVPPKLYKGTRYLDPITEVQKEVDILKGDYNCDFVICLSHLGYKYNAEYGRVSDVVLAENTRGLDLILGGHTHTFMRRPDKRQNKVGQEVLINQCGWGGILLGKVDLHFEKNRKGKCITCRNKLIK